MHKDDQMTPKERAFALFAGKPVDRMPIKLFSPYIGMNFGASYQDAFVEANHALTGLSKATNVSGKMA